MKFLLISTLALTLLGCASTDTLTRQEKNAAYQGYIATHQLSGVKEIKTFQMRNWYSLTDSYLIVSVAFNKNYLLALKNKCFDLEYAQTLITHLSISNRFSTNFDAIAVPTAPRIKCYVDSIYPITKEQLKEIKAIGKAVGEEKLAKPAEASVVVN